MVKSLFWKFVVLSVLFCLSEQGRAQVDFTTTPIDISSYPLVKTQVSVTNNGESPWLDITNFYVSEDGQPVSNLQIVDCEDQSAAAVVMLVDISSSMYFTVPSTYVPYFNNSFSHLIKAIKAPSEFAMIPFGDTIESYIPGNNRPDGYYQAENTVDTSEFMFTIGSINRKEGGGTNPDLAVDSALNYLKKSSLSRKVLVFISDDAIRDFDKYYKIFKQEGITLYVLEAGDSYMPGNDSMARAMGGRYLQAPDPMSYVTGMATIGRSIMGKRCTLQYTSTLPCVWQQKHKVDITLLKFGSGNPKVQLQYGKGSNTLDKDPPAFTILEPADNARRVTATDDFPCNAGMKSFRDSLLVNFAKMRSRIFYPDSCYDSLVVTNLSLPARAVYVAVDSLGNRSVQEVIYNPPSDTLKPEILLPIRVGNSYIVNVQEIRKWDKGLQTVTTLPGSTNFVLDKVTYNTKQFARVELHVADPKKPANVCIQAIDSVGHDSVYCITWPGEGADTLEPIIVQDPIKSPLKTLSATITEKRSNDIGIKTVTVTPISNTSAPLRSYTDKSLATASVTITDSLFDAFALVTVTDSSGNISQDTLKYFTTPDTQDPVCLLSTIDANTQQVASSDMKAWDRGIASMTVVSSVNMTPSAVTFTDKWHASIQGTRIDPSQNASLLIRSTDSVGHSCDMQMYIPGDGKMPLQPLSAASPINFGTRFAPITIGRTADATNFNADPVTITKVRSTGDVGVITFDDNLPITIDPGKTYQLPFSFSPVLLGNWYAQYIFSNDTMDLATVDLIGRSIGKVNVSVDTVQVAKAGDNGVLHVKVDAVPQPINLDTIKFTLDYGIDEVEVTGPAQLHCSGIEPICNYDLVWNPSPNGTAEITLIRKDLGLPSVLSFDSIAIDIPFTTYVSKSDKRTILVSAAAVSQGSEVTVSSGLVEIGSICADSTLRTAMNGRLSTINSISPNPAHSDITVHVSSSDRASAVLSILDILGNVRMQITKELSQGENAVAVRTAGLPAGTYTVRLSSAGSISSRMIQVIR